MAADGYLETIPSSEHVAVTHGLFRHHGCEGIPLGLMTDESELIGHSLSGKKKHIFWVVPTLLFQNVKQSIKRVTDCFSWRQL